MACQAVAYSEPTPSGGPQAAPAQAVQPSKQAPQLSQAAQAVQPVRQSQPAPAASASAVNPITEAAVKAGVLSCVKRIEQVARYLTGGTDSGAYLFPPARQPDQGVFSASLELQRPNATPMYASASFSPGGDGGCTGVYDAVEWSPRSCAELQKAVSKSQAPATPVKKDIGILIAGPAKLFFMPAGSGCVVIKKEVVQ